MRIMMNSVVLVAVFSLVGLKAAACSCVPCDGKSLVEMPYVDAIFAADVLKARQVGPNKRTEGRIWMEYTMRPVEVVKGKLGKKVIVKSPFSDAECGVTFKAKTRVAVAATKQSEGGLAVNLCTHICWANPANQALLTLKTEN